MLICSCTYYLVFILCFLFLQDEFLCSGLTTPVDPYDIVQANALKLKYTVIPAGGFLIDCLISHQSFLVYLLMHIFILLLFSVCFPRQQYFRSHAGLYHGNGKHSPTTSGVSRTIGGKHNGYVTVTAYSPSSLFVLSSLLSNKFNSLTFFTTDPFEYHAYDYEYHPLSLPTLELPTISIDEI